MNLIRQKGELVVLVAREIEIYKIREVTNTHSGFNICCDCCGNRIKKDTSYFKLYTNDIVQIKRICINCNNLREIKC